MCSFDCCCPPDIQFSIVLLIFSIHAVGDVRETIRIGDRLQIIRLLKEIPTLIAHVGLRSRPKRLGEDHIHKIPHLVLQTMQYLIIPLTMESKKLPMDIMTRVPLRTPPPPRRTMMAELVVVTTPETLLV